MTNLVTLALVVMVAVIHLAATVVRARTLILVISAWEIYLVVFLVVKLEVIVAGGNARHVGVM